MSSIKKCSKCKEVKDISEYWKDASKGCGLSSRCKLCDSKKTVQWGQKNPNKKSKNDQKYHNKKGYRKYKKDRCEQCGFIPLHSCQLDVDHTDGDHKNDALSNLRTLCANCHRLKTYYNREYSMKVRART